MEEFYLGIGRMSGMVAGTPVEGTPRRACRASGRSAKNAPFGAKKRGSHAAPPPAPSTLARRPPGHRPRGEAEAARSSAAGSS